MRFDEFLVTGATGALGLGAVWALLVLGAAVAEVLSDGRLALTTRLGCPAPLRRALLTGLGVVLASGGAGMTVPGSAASAPLSPGVGGGASADAGMPIPARPTGAAHSLPHQRVEVDPGDSLWRLTRQRAPRASTQDVARLVDRTYRANRRVIGPDPDLIHPGQQLRIPQQRRHHPPTSETP